MRKSRKRGHECASGPGSIARRTAPRSSVYCPSRFRVASSRVRAHAKEGQTFKERKAIGRTIQIHTCFRYGNHDRRLAAASFRLLSVSKRRFPRRGRSVLRSNVLSVAEQELLAAFAKSHGLKCMTKAAFIDDIFYGLGYDLRATILGFNLPFDLSRLATRHHSARGKMRGGFSFQLSEDKWKARVQVKHLAARAALIQFAATEASRHERRSKKETP